ncbi:MAG: PrsW family intramembrane metalloprotease, partial [Candidatus Sungbacteria bacterium]|nr:PrsW family intramembrane metalloprotease [Candidatus Sungbacteria bacterium]
LVFVGGMVSAIFAIVAELVFFGDCQATNDLANPCIKGLLPYLYPPLTMATFPFLVFFGIAFIEEYFKYGAVKILALRRADFDEPIDAMIYMITAALGFAALENALFIVPEIGRNFDVGFQLTANRFIGANLLHATASGIVGFFLARAFFSHYRHHFLGFGILLASLLHTAFNYLIINKELFPSNIDLLILLLSTMTLVVLIEFEQLKKKTNEPWQV